MSQFYEIDSTRITLREYWWGAKSPLVIIVWLLKWLHIRIPISLDDPNTDSTLPFVAESLPPEIADSFGPLTGELSALGFSDPVYHVISDAGTRTTFYWATFRHESGKFYARIHRRVWQKAPRSSGKVFPLFFTAFTDGTFLVSSAGNPDMAPPVVQLNPMRRAKTSRLCEAHQRLAEQAGERKMIAPVKSREELIKMTEQLHVLLRDFHLARGVFRPRTAEEQAKANEFAASVAQSRAGGLEHAEILAEMQKLQEQKPGWAAAGWVLVISLVLFLALGAARWNWRFTLLIIPVLLFHECGHWAAMRIFHYRNLRMFFIPLFGAAVTGRNWNVPGWKKAIVSLAGPLPGIALGIFLGVAGLVSKKPLLTEASYLLVFINGFNLLPVLPLDGGHVLHTILFCRNRWLDVIFRLLAIGGLLLLSVAGLGKVFMYLAIFMGISLPVAFKLARATDSLREANLPPPLPDEDQIPVLTAQAIITEVKTAFPKGVSNKAIAQHALNVFETLNAKPPGPLVTIGLLAVHGGAFFLVVIFSIVLILGKYGGLGDFTKAAIRQPQHSFECGSSQRWVGDEFQRLPPRTRSLLVVTFDRRGKAASMFADSTNQVPAAGQLVWFGDSIMLALPADDDNAREQWFDRFQAQSTNVFVAISNQPVMVTLTFIVPTAMAATNISREISDYTGMPAGMRLIPPWSPEARRPDFKACHEARREWRRIDLELAKIWRNSSLTNYPTKIVAAIKRGDKKEATRLRTGQEKLNGELQTKIYEDLRNCPTNRIDSALIELHQRLTKLSYTNRMERISILRELAPRLGRVKYQGDEPVPGADAYGSCSGIVLQHGLLVEIEWISLNEATTGLPALTDWLCDLGCRQIRYEIFGGFSDLGLDD